MPANMASSFANPAPAFPQIFMYSRYLASNSDSFSLSFGFWAIYTTNTTFTSQLLQHS